MSGMFPDVIHETYHCAHPLCRSSLSRVLTVYDMIHERYSDNFSNQGPAIRYKQLAVDRSDHVICISHSA